MQRRHFLQGTAAGAVAAVAWGDESAQQRRLQIGFSLYGMKGLPLEEAVRTCREIGYDCVELPVMKDWPGDPAVLKGSQLERFRHACAIPVVALMENLKLLADEAEHRQNLDRLKRAFDLAHGLKFEKVPVIETILGGAPNQWEASKQQMVARLGEWAEACTAGKVKLAIKAHVGNAAHLPQHVVWLLDLVKSDALVAAYDYSHFELRGLALAESLKTLIDRTRFIHVKDASGSAERFKFLLPGQGTTDYVDYMKLLDQHDYAGPLVVEVSGQIFSQPGYDAIAAARQCFKTLSTARERAAQG